MILHVGESGELVLPGELVQEPPHTKLLVERHGENLVIGPVMSEALANKASQPEEDMTAFWETFPSFDTGTIDSLATFRREDIYDDADR